MIEKLINLLIKTHIKTTNKIPNLLYINPEDLAELRDSIKIHYSKNLTHYKGLKLLVKPNAKLKIGNETYSKRYLLS